jgi:O-antigen ligase
VRDQGGYFPTSWGWSALALLAVCATWLLAGARSDFGRFDAAFLALLAFLVAWVAASIAWSVDPAQSVFELERWLVLLAGCAALLVLARRRSPVLVTPALLAAVTGVCGYSLATRLDPVAGRFHPRDPTSGYRLFEPVGYWNGLGEFAAIGVVLALGVATDPRSRRGVRALGAVGLVVTALALYFTFSRGAWLALVCGVVVLVACSPRRLQLLAEGGVLGVAPAIAILLASHSPALTDQAATLRAAREQGHHLAWVLVAIVAAAVAAVPLLAVAERRIRLAGRPRVAVRLGLSAVVAAAIVAGVVHGGGPVDLATRSYDSFVAPRPPKESADLNRRLTDLNGNGRARLWSVAVDALHGRRWLVGTGAGAFQRVWDGSPRADEAVRDAHGLYVETLSELGVAGLVALVALLALPFVAARSRRTVPYVPALLGAYTTFVLHNGVDWDWELSGVALTGLFLGCLLILSRRSGAPRVVPPPTRVAGGLVVAALAAFAIVAVVGNGALARAHAANAARDYASGAADARTAHTWMPWSSDPLKTLGEAQFRRGDTVAAQASFRRAVAVDDNDWQAWLDLAATVAGRERSAAVAKARALYPTSIEVVEFEEAVREHRSG